MSYPLIRNANYEGENSVIHQAARDITGYYSDYPQLDQALDALESALGENCDDYGYIIGSESAISEAEEAVKAEYAKVSDAMMEDRSRNCSSF